MKINKLEKRIISLILAVLSTMCLILSSIYPYKAYADTALGTNKALGSPVLNKDAVADDWNIDESYIWGIFLSNFCIPFIDSYESAFNLNSNWGSKGRGTKALNFSAGSDLSTNDILKNLLSYAINMQAVSPKPVYVSYTTKEDGVYTAVNAFDTMTKYNLKTVNDDGSEVDITKSTTRQATLKDLFITGIDSDIELNQTSAALKNGELDCITLANYIKRGESTEENYDDNIYKVKIAKTYNIPTFAIPKSGASGGYQIVLDYNDPYDIQMLIGALVYGLNYNKEGVKEVITNGDNFANYPLVIDSFGNICIQRDNRYIVVFPASANQYIKEGGGINLVNSIMFNAGTSQNTQDNIVLNAGADSTSTGFWSKGNPTYDIKQMTGGFSALNNGSKRTKNGGMMIYFDTDNVLIQQLVDNYLENKDFETTQDNRKYIEQFKLPTESLNIVHQGKVIQSLFDTEIGNNNGYNIKIEPMNIGSDIIDNFSNELQTSIGNTFQISHTIANLSKANESIETLSEIKRVDGSSDLILYKKDEKDSTYSNAAIVSVLMPEGITSSGKYTQFSVLRMVPQYIYNYYKSNNKKALVTTGYNNVFNKNSSAEILEGFVFSDSNNDYFSDAAVDFLDSLRKQGTMFRNGNGDTTTEDMKTVRLRREGFFQDYGAADAISIHQTRNDDNIISRFIAHNKYDENANKGFFGDNINNEQFAELTFNRLIKFFIASPVLEEVSRYLGIQDGTGFSAYASDIYYTYLTWYGLKKNNITGEFTSNLNKDLLNPDIGIKDVQETIGLKSEEEKQQEITNYAYLMLHPSDGRDYRAEITISRISSFIYEQYQKIVYGGADTYYYSTVATKSNTGFLDVPNYSENPFTSWLIDIYPTFAIIVIGLGTIFIIIAGTIKRNKISWVLGSIIVVITVVLVLPSSGEFVPYVANNVVEDIFKDNMTFWSISEQAANKYKTDEFTSSRLSEEQVASINKLINTNKSLYLDRYISIKQDISNKVTMRTADGFNEIQNSKSVRWMLPQIIREYTNNNRTTDYVYVPLGDKLDDCANLYFAFNPAKEASSEALTLNMFNDKTSTLYRYKQNDGDISTYNYKAFTNTIKDTDEVYSWQARSLTNNVSSTISQPAALADKPHTYFYILDNKNNSDILNKSIIDTVKNSDEKHNDWVARCIEEMVEDSNTENYLEQSYLSGLTILSGQYNRYERDTVRPNMGYFWTTESPLHYFYQNTLDSFDIQGDLGTITNSILGKYVQRADGTEYRKTIMTSDESGEVRDFLDLENMFTNLMPYMYSMQIATNGHNDTNGFEFYAEKLGDEYSTHKDETRGWIFRSNWVTKIFDNPEYNEPMTIKDSSGTKYTVNNPLLPQYYPGWDAAQAGDSSARTMVFSRAQMVEQGLDEGDLNIVELKCVNINDEVYRAWTSLINYINVSGMSREVIYRQMALEATMKFCENLSPSGLTTFKHKLYPTSLDLRTISFDSVMKLIMLNTTHNSNYIYGDSMDVLVDDSDIITQIMLLIVAVLSATVIPLVRNLGLALIFFMGFVVVFQALFKPATETGKNSLGYLGCNLLMLGLNIAYFIFIWALISLNVTDQVIDVSSKGLRIGNPLWIFIMLMIIDIIYIVFNIKLIVFCIKNFRDAGYAAMSVALTAGFAGISSGIEKFASQIGSAASSNDGTTTTNPTKPIPDPVNQGDSRRNRGSSTRGSGDTTSDEVSRTKDSSDESQYSEEYFGDNDDIDDNSYNTTRDEDTAYVDQSVDDVNEIIRRGKIKDSSENDDDGQDNIDNIDEDDDI